jgi:hypothetical protein
MKSVVFKFILNIVLAVSFVFLMDEWSFLGLTFHEMAGLVVCLFYILHILLNWAFVKEITLRFFSRTTAKCRLNYVLDVLLLVGFALIIISGMGIAKTIDFAWLGFDGTNRGLWRPMHTSVAMIVLMLVGIHIGLHWDWVLARFRRSNGRKSC